MKKIIALFLVALTLVSLLAVSALADDGLTNWSFGYTGSTNGTTLSNANNFKQKQTTANYIEVRHAVIGNGAGAGFTNLMYACIFDAPLVYTGPRWHAPDMIYWVCSGYQLASTYVSVTPGGRANTKYYENLGFTSIRMEGQFRTH